MEKSYSWHDWAIDEQHTLGHIQCTACTMAVSAMLPNELAVLPLVASANLWLNSRKNIDSSTRANYSHHIKTLLRFFSHLSAAEITNDHIAKYQLARQKGLVPGLPRHAGASIINHEVNTLQQIMVRAGEWHRIADWYEPLPLPKETKRRALTEDEERRLFEVAASRPRWHVAYCCAVICANTTAGAGEIRRLQLQDVDLQRRTIRIVGGAKNDSRIRTLPLNDAALYAVRELYVRACKLGAYSQEHYLLPFKSWNKRGMVDPSRPAGGWRTAWKNLTSAASLTNVGFHGLRHHVITKMLEDPAIPERVVSDLAGHVSNKMLDTYSHTRTSALRGAVDRITTGIKQKGTVTEICSASARPQTIKSLPANSPPQSSPTSGDLSRWITFSSTTLQPMLRTSGIVLPPQSSRKSSK